MANQPLAFQQENNDMLPFGKQQDILGFLFDDKPKRAAGTLFIEGVSDPHPGEEAGKHIFGVDAVMKAVRSGRLFASFRGCCEEAVSMPREAN
jgi:hypothetical protein